MSAAAPVPVPYRTVRQRRFAGVLAVLLAVIGTVLALAPDAPAAGATVTVWTAVAPAAFEIPGPVNCPAATVTVHSAKQLKTALSAARPGASIRLAPGRYVGRFSLEHSGSAAHPIYLCGSTATVLDGGRVSSGTGLHLQNASYVRLVGFTVTDAQKGIVLDRSSRDMIDAVTVTNVGEEGIHLRTFSSDNLVYSNRVLHTGLKKAQFGEGIYIGSAKSNWCTYTGCAADRSDHNQIIGNGIAATGAESIDVKEGTQYGTLVRNSFTGTGMSAADSWVDVKGNHWSIKDNTGRYAPVDGFQTHQVVAGWGTANVFSGNSATVHGSGYGIALRPALGNVVLCNNRVSAAGSGLSNVACRAH